MAITEQADEITTAVVANSAVPDLQRHRKERSRAEVPAQPDWRKRLHRCGDSFVGDERNVLFAFQHAPDLLRLVRFNEFTLNIELTRAPPWRCCGPGTPWSERDDAGVMVWLQKQNIAVRSGKVVEQAVLLEASEHAFHPVREYLEGLVWDSTERLPTLVETYFGAAGNPDYNAAIGRRFMISAVARILRPGCQADHMLVLEGAQGIGKTSVVRTLSVMPEWFAGNLPDIRSKDAPLQLVGRWFVEIAELKAVRNSQVEATKSFITETSDTFRPPYARRTRSSRGRRSSSAPRMRASTCGTALAIAAIGRSSAAASTSRLSPAIGINSGPKPCTSSTPAQPGI